MNIDIAWLATQFPDLQQLALLSKGGQKLVASAVHPRDGDVVLKVIRPDQDAKTTQREILAVSQVQSGRVPRIFEHGNLVTPIGDCVWLREQRVLGQNVREMLKAGPLRPEQYLRLGLHVSEALVAAENARIVHRDVKPENIICDNNGDFWLIDFGIARHLTLSSLTATADIWGKATVGYAPTEQVRNLKPDIDARSDLYALGVTLYEVITGGNPFFQPPAANKLEVIRRMEQERNQRITPLALAFPGGPELWDLIAAMTQNRRDLRPRMAQEAFTWMQDICTKSGI
jgi:serine/threonine protein kinase